MDLERTQVLFVPATLLVLAAAWLLLHALRRRDRAYPLRAILVVVALAVVWTAAGHRYRIHNRPSITNRPIQIAEEGYVSSETCRACHPSEYASWHGSYHRTMTQVASPATVAAGPHDQRIEFDGRTYLIERRGDELWVEMDDPDWTGPESGRPRIERHVVLTTGSHHRQYLWFATEKGRTLAQFPFTYLIEEKRWVHRTAGFVKPPSDDVTTYPASWNTKCIHCHTTRGQPHAVGALAQTDTRVAEFGIACEACHGPAEEHTRLHRSPRSRYAMRFSDDPDPTIVQPERLRPDRASQVCGQCHGVFDFESLERYRELHEHGTRFKPGDDLMTSRVMVQYNERTKKLPIAKLLVERYPNYFEEQFWSDGMVRVTGREFTGLLETPCYTHGDEQAGILSCLSCHGMHKNPDDPRPLAEWADDQLKPGMEGDQACLQCHTSYAADLESHTRHRPGSTGSRCYNCHMPYTTYGLHKAVRSHTVDSPSVAVSLDTGRPNACNLCHLDKTLAWTADHLQRWYEIPPPALAEDERLTAASLLWLLRGDAGQRVLLVWGMGWEAAQQASGTDWLPPFLGQMMLDPYDAVRLIAHRSLRGLPGYEGLRYRFDAPREERKRSVHEVIRRWERGRTTGRFTTGRSILIAPDGRFLEEEHRRLLSQRDDRPVFLVE